MYILKSNNNESKYGEISSGYYELKKSKFYSYIFNISNIKEIDNYLALVKKDNKKAKHFVYAYEFYSDNVKFSKFSNDNEPKKTGINASITMLEYEQVTNYLIIIVRYYGGILLGAGTLLRSYLTSFKLAFGKCRKENI